MIPSVLTTAPREGADYLPATLASLEAAGFRTPLIAAEPESPVPDGVEVLFASERLGPWLNWLRALRELIERYPRAEAYVVFQDDIQVARGAAAWLRQQLWPSPRAGVLSLYTASSLCETPKNRRKGNARRQLKVVDGWNTTPRENLPGRVYGALACCIRPEAARELLVDPPSGGKVAADCQIGVFCKRSGWHHLFHVPSVVRHVGEVTAIPRGPRKFNPGMTRHRREGRWLERC